MERRKIIIPIGPQPGEPLPPPHFDAEATQTAHRVVPLSEQDAARMQQGANAPGAQKSFWKRPAGIALIVLLLASIGGAAGFAVIKLRNRQAAQTPAANNTQPTADENAKPDQSAGDQSQPQPTPETRASAPAKPAETPARTERDNQKGDDRQTTPPVARDNKRDQKSDDDQTPDQKQTERQRRRDEQREARRRQRDEDNSNDIPGQIDRTGRQINNRIREIFEGRLP